LTPFIFNHSLISLAFDTVWSEPKSFAKLLNIEFLLNLQACITIRFLLHKTRILRIL